MSFSFQERFCLKSQFILHENRIRGYPRKEGEQATAY
jgi:hypothetical protein